MTVEVIDDHPDGWLARPVDEPTPVVELCTMLTDQVRKGLRGVPRTESLMTAVRQARNKAKRDDGEPTKEQLGLAFALAKQLLLDRDDRLALAEVVLEREVESWSDLSWNDLSRIIDSMQGYVQVRHLRLERSSNPARAEG